MPQSFSRIFSVLENFFRFFYFSLRGLFSFLFGPFPCSFFFPFRGPFWPFCKTLENGDFSLRISDEKLPFLEAVLKGKKDLPDGVRPAGYKKNS